MKEMIKRVREEKGGFTLAELLIVVAIILVLVAIAIPVFTGALNNANDAVQKADIRSVKAVAVSQILLEDTPGNGPWEATANVDDEGNVGEVTVTSVGTAGDDSAEPATSPATGYDVTVYITATDVPASEDTSSE